MKKLGIFLLGALLLCAALPVQAKPAYPGKITYVQPDGTRIVLQKHGDEWGHWVTDESGRVVAMDADGFYRPTGEDPSLVAQAASIRRRARRNVQARVGTSGHVAQGKKHFLVIMVAFNDVAFKYTQSDVYNQLNQVGYSANGATGSARDYYYKNSQQTFEPVFDVYGPVTLENDMAYYGKNVNGIQGYDTAPEEAVIEGCKALDGQVDFSQFDNDNDGKVDLVFMLYAGYSEADTGNSNTIWPHQWELSSAGKNLKLDGKTIDSYACSSELAGAGSLKDKLDGIGSVCHEFGHAMGLPDFYDADYETNGEAGGLYDFSVMCEGCYNNDGRTPPYFNIEERILLGWINESDAYQSFNGSGSYSIPAIRPENNSLVAYKTPTDKDGEYFVYECRGNSGYDQYLTGHGLVVYQVDKSSRDVKIKDYNGNTITRTASELWYNWPEFNSINENGSHPCFRVVPATDQSNNRFSIYSGYDKIPFPGKGNVMTYTAKSWNGVAGDYALTNIAFSSNQSTFTVTTSAVSTAGLDYYAIDNPGNGVYSRGNSFALKLVEPTDPGTLQSVSWTYDGTAVNGGSVSLTASGLHVIEATLNLGGGRQDILTLEIMVQ